MTASGSLYQSDEAERRRSVSVAGSISFNRSFAVAFVLRVRDEGAAGVTRLAPIPTELSSVAGPPSLLPIPSVLKNKRSEVAIKDGATDKPGPND